MSKSSHRGTFPSRLGEGQSPTKRETGEVIMSEVVYVSRARIEFVRGPIRHGYLGNVPEPVVYGMQGDLRAWYKVGPDEPDTASTLDHIVAAVGA